jgi:hypothetical protein
MKYLNKILHVPLWGLILLAISITTSYIVIRTGHNTKYREVYELSESRRTALEKCQSQAYAREAENEADSLIRTVIDTIHYQPAKEYLSKFKTKK